LKLYRPFWEIVQLGFANSDHPKYHSSFAQKNEWLPAIGNTSRSKFFGMFRDDDFSSN